MYASFTLSSQGQHSVALELIQQTAAREGNLSTTALSTPYYANGSVYYRNGDPSIPQEQNGVYRDGTLILSPGQEIDDAGTCCAPQPSGSDGTTIIMSVSTNFMTDAPNRFLGSRVLISGSTLTRVLDLNTPIPGLLNPRTRNIYGRSAIDGNEIAFHINRDRFSEPPSPSGIGRVSTNGGAVSLIATEGSPVPNDGGVFIEFENSTRVAVDGPNIYFAGRAQELTGSLTGGLYRSTAGNLTTVVDSSMPRPGGGTFSFLDFERSDIEAEGSVVVFSVPRGLYKSENGVLSLVSDSNNPPLGAEAGLFDFNDLSLRNGKIVFRGSRFNQFSPPQLTGIYSDFGGEVATVAVSYTHLTLPTTPYV